MINLYPEQGRTLRSFADGKRKEFETDLKKVPISVCHVAANNLPDVSALSTHLGVQKHIFTIAASNALMVYLTNSVDRVFSRLKDKVNRSGKTYLSDMVNLHLNFIRILDARSIRYIIYLTYIEQALGKVEPSLTDNIILPEEEKCRELLQVIDFMARVMKPNRSIALWPSLEGAYNNTIVEGTINFLIDETLWLIRLHRSAGNTPPTLDYAILITAYIMLKRSHLYKNKEIRFLSVIYPLDGRYFKIDVAHISQQLINKLTQAVYGISPSTTYTPMGTVGATKTTGVNRKVVNAFLLTTKDNDIHKELKKICGKYFDAKRIKKLYRQIAYIYDKPSIPFDPTCRYCQNRVILLHKLYYTIEHIREGNLVIPGLSNEQIKATIVEAAKSSTLFNV